MASNVLRLFHPPVADWFASAFDGPTRPQRQGWPVIATGQSTLILAPTGTGKTLTAFLACLDRLMFAPVPPRDARCRVLYLSPLKALAVDVERNLRAPLAGIAHLAAAAGVPHHVPAMSIRTGDTPTAERTRFQRDPADILITTPESLFLLLTSNARERLRAVDTVIVDEIHALVSTKRGAHMALSLERLERIVERPLQRIGLSATQRNLDEIARFLGGTIPAGATRAAARPGAAPIRRVPCTTSSPTRRPAPRARSPSSTPASRRSWRSPSRCRSPTWPRSASRSSSRAARRRRADRCRRSGRRSIRACWSWCAPTARPCSSSTAAASPSGWPPRSTSWPASRWCAPTTDRSPAPSAPRLRTCSRRAGCGRWWRPRRSSWASTWAPSTWWCRSKRRRRWPADCSASAGPATGWTRPAKG